MQRILFVIIMFVVTFFVFNYAIVAATTYNCTPMADTRLDSATPDTNYGTATTLKMVGSGVGGPVRSIISVKYTAICFGKSDHRAPI